MTAANSVGTVVPELAMRLRTRSFVWRLRTEIGGYRRIQGALTNLVHEVAPGTIANILKEHGMEPAPERNRKTTLGGDRIRQLLHHRGMDTIKPHEVYGALSDRPIDMAR